MKTLYSHSAIDVKNNEFECIEFNVLENELDEFETTIMASTYLRVVHQDVDPGVDTGPS